MWRIGSALAALVLGCISGGAGAATPLALQLSGPRQAQFAGYYVALARDYYTAEGLAVTVRPGVPNGDSAVPVAASGIDVWSAWMPQALAARTAGLPLVNFAQIFPHSGRELVCRKASGIHSPADFRGRSMAVWPGIAAIPFLAWMKRLGLVVGGKDLPGDVTMLPVARVQGLAAAAPMLRREAACLDVLNYDQYWSLLDAGLSEAELQGFYYGTTGMATLQDGLYATEAALADPARAAALAGFLRASLRGWQYAVAHQAEAVDAVLADGAPHSEADRQHQLRMMSAVARLTESGLHRMGWLEPAAYGRTVQLLVEAGGASPLVSTPPAAWTHAVWDRAQK